MAEVAGEYQISKSPFCEKRDNSLISKYPWIEMNITFTRLSLLYNLFKEHDYLQNKSG